MSKVVALIPAKLDSARFPRKNLALFQGLPLVAQAVKVANEARTQGLVSEVAVSSESEEVMRAAQFGGPFAELWRRGGLASADQRVIDVLRGHLREWPGLLLPDAVCVLLPTSPLRQSEHVCEALELFADDVNVVLSVTPFRQDVSGAVFIPDGWVRGWMQNRWVPARSYFKHDGTVAILRTTHVLNGGGFYGSGVRPYYVPTEQSVDVDLPIDLEYAAFLRARLSPQPGGPDGPL